MILLKCYFRKLETFLQKSQVKQPQKPRPEINLKIVIPCYLSSSKEIGEIQIKSCQEYMDSLKLLIENTSCKIYTFYSLNYFGDTIFIKNAITSNLFKIEYKQKSKKQNKSLEKYTKNSLAKYLPEILKLIIQNDSYGFLPHSKFLYLNHLKMPKEYLLFYDYNFQYISEEFISKINRIVKIVEYDDTFYHKKLITFLITFKNNCFTEYKSGIFCALINSWRVEQLSEFIKIVQDAIDINDIFSLYSEIIKSGKPVEDKINVLFDYVFKFSVPQNISVGKIELFHHTQYNTKYFYFKKHLFDHQKSVSIINGIVFKNEKISIDMMHVAFEYSEKVQTVYFRWGTNLDISDYLDFSYIIDIDGSKTVADTRELSLKIDKSVKKLMIYPFGVSQEMLLAELIFIYV